MQIRLAVVAALLTVILSACGGDAGYTKGDPTGRPSSESDVTTTDTATQAEPEPEIPACDTMKAGAPIDDSVLNAVENGCYGETNDDIYLDTYVVGECKDGRQMVEHADVLYGFVREKWQTGDVNSSGYKAAVAECAAE